MTTMKEFVEAENKKLEAENKEFYEKNQYPGFWTPEKGETRFEIMPNEPRQKEFKGKMKVIFHVKVGGVEKDWAVNPKNPAYRELVKRLSKGQTSFVLLRTGSDTETRYEFLDK